MVYRLVCTYERDVSLVVAGQQRGGVPDDLADLDGAGLVEEKHCCDAIIAGALKRDK